MEKQNQTFKIKENSEKSQLNYDYSELDQFLDEKCDPITLYRDFQDFQSAYACMMSLILVEQIKEDRNRIYCPNKRSTIDFYYLEKFFQILDRLQINEGRE